MAANNPDQEIDPEDSEELPVRPVASEPSAVIVLPPRELQSQIGFENVVITEEEIDSYVITFDELGAPTGAAKSTVSLRVSRGKSQVNLTDPSRIHRRAPQDPPRRIFPEIEDEPGDIKARRSFDGGQRKSVKFNSQQNVLQCIPFQQGQNEGQNLTEPVAVSNLIFPSPRSEKPPENVKSEYNFFKSGQTMEAVLGKVQKLRARMQAMADKLKQLSFSCKVSRPVKKTGDETQVETKENQEQTQTEEVDGSTVDDKDEEESIIIEIEISKTDEELEEIEDVQEPSTGTVENQNPAPPVLPGETDDISDSVGTSTEPEQQNSPTENTEPPSDFQRRPSRLLLKDPANKNMDSNQAEQDKAPD